MGPVSVSVVCGGSACIIRRRSGVLLGRRDSIFVARRCCFCAVLFLGSGVFRQWCYGVSEGEIEVQGQAWQVSVPQVCSRRQEEAAGMQADEDQANRKLSLQGLV